MRRASRLFEALLQTRAGEGRGLERLTKSRDPRFADEAGVVNLVRKDGDDGEAVGVGRALGADRAADSEGAEAAPLSGSQAARRPQGVDRDFVRVADGDRVGVLAAGDGLRLGDDLLAQVAGVAGGGCLAAAA